MIKSIAAIDQGTSSTRCMLFNQAGGVIGKAQVEHRQIYPRPGWVEHDPLEIWECTQQVIHQALTRSGLGSGSIAAVGITNQRETTVVWDCRSGKPFGNAIVWQDTRTKEMIDSLAARDGIDRLRPKTGLPLATYFSGPKLAWILENDAAARQAAKSGDALFGTIDTWLTWWLTGGPNGGAHVTDVTNASRTLLMDLLHLEWDQEILDLMSIPRSMLPRIVPSMDPEPWGYTLSDGPFADRIPVCGGLGDQQAALVGQACFSAGQAKNTYGTGCFMLMNTGTKPIPSESGLITTVAYKVGDQQAVYALEGSIAVTGALIQWLRDNLEIIETAPDVEPLARSVEDNGGVYFVPAFSGLYAPHWRMDARGVIVGLTRFVNKGHIARAALEATAYQSHEVLQAMANDSGVQLAMLKVDGGMVHNELLMQFQADILQVQVVRPAIAETTSLGAAYAAGLAVGLWSDFEELRTQWKVERSWEPKMGLSQRDELVAAWQKAIERTLNWVE